ncbi:unnamed protein product [Didymodactylos carnosus]|uniref:U-box domain-containing protein n=1 Tax=Didymodactylos carnosus TaxID=1234261 RepID=A0A815PBR3_9BILA|nr:unnamed protein product [Didymodactylos carnosus]CAF1446900.1 unnamed protein product [Didymodactylos carnosus]CAF4230923.1 unnamed protein product [Didymodactylos carnosus]CAF4321385.1 unnamed protein product [Didymodactylos carnosus]
MAGRSQRPVTPTIDDLNTLARENKDFDTIYQCIMKHPEWLTQIPSGRRWGIIHQIVFHGNVDQLNRLLTQQAQNPNFLLLSKTGDDKTVLDIAREEVKKNAAMYKRIERLTTMDELLSNAKAENWTACRDLLKKMPDIINEKPAYRRFYFIHQIAYVGDRRVFDEFNQQYHFDLNLLSNNDKSAVDIANDQGHHDFAKYVKSLKEKNQSRTTSDQISRANRAIERSRASDYITAATSEDPHKTQNDDGRPLPSNGGGILVGLQPNEKENLINSLTCPLSGKILRVPVVASDGYTYEKENILEWFKTNDKSPVTNEVFKDRELKQNYTIETILKSVPVQSSLPTTLPTSMSTYYTIKAGDTLTKLAEQNGFSLDQIKAANPELKNYDRLAIGQHIKFPRKRRETFSRD